MSDADIKANIGVSTDVEQATQRTQKGIISMQKQIEDIQKKFSSAGKDIFLSLVGPMALFGTAIGFIGKLIEENQRKHADARQAAIDGTNELISVEERYYAKKRENDKKAREDKKQAAVSIEDITKEFLLNEALGRAYVFKKEGGDPDKQLPWWLRKLRSITGSEEQTAALLSKSKEAQMFVQTALMEMRREKPLPGDANVLQTPAGFSNVVGVGANPVMEAMNAQLEEAQKQTALLEKIASPEGGVPKDFTKDTK